MKKKCSVRTPSEQPKVKLTTEKKPKRYAHTHSKQQPNEKVLKKGTLNVICMHWRRQYKRISLLFVSCLPSHAFSEHSHTTLWPIISSSGRPFFPSFPLFHSHTNTLSLSPSLGFIHRIRNTIDRHIAFEQMA